MTRRPSGSHILALVVTTAALALSTALLPAVAGAEMKVPARLAATAPMARTPLSVAITDGSATWASVAMGRTDEVEDTFWQLLLRSGSGPWRVATPPGVADNGGLVATVTAGEGLLSGFLPSQDLRFTPLARTAAGRPSWSGSVLPKLLAPDPDALAVSAAGTSYALLESPTEIESSGPALSRWQRATSLSALRALRVTDSCGLSSLAAISTDAAGHLVVGGSCRRAGTVGLFVSGSGTWRRLAASIPAVLSGARFQVLRLQQGAGGLSGLLVATEGGRRWLVELRQASVGGPVQLTESKPLASGQRLLSSGSLATGGLYAVLSASSAIGPSLFGAPGGGPPRLPAGTSTVVIASSGHLEAFVAAGKKLTIWNRSGSDSWRVEQVVTVPLDYASSS